MVSLWQAEEVMETVVSTFVASGRERRLVE
jgi:hypothetical protein